MTIIFELHVNVEAMSSTVSYYDKESPNSAGKTCMTSLYMRRNILTASFALGQIDFFFLLFRNTIFHFIGKLRFDA